MATATMTTSSPMNQIANITGRSGVVPMTTRD
jgi:hypothetical protein